MWTVPIVCSECQDTVHLDINGVAIIVAQILGGNTSIAPCQKCEAKRAGGLVVPKNSGKLTRLPFNRPDGLA